MTLTAIQDRAVDGHCQLHACTRLFPMQDTRGGPDRLPCISTRGCSDASAVICSGIIFWKVVGDQIVRRMKMAKDAPMFGRMFSDIPRTRHRRVLGALFYASNKGPELASQAVTA